MSKKNLELWVLEANDLIQINEYEKANALLDKYIKETLKNTENDPPFLCFRDFIEYYAYFRKDFLATKEDVIWSPTVLDRVYVMKAFINNEMGDFKNALININEAYNYNPLNTNILFEKAETHKLMGDYNKMLSAIKYAYEFIYNAYDLARYYMYYGLYYQMFGQVKVAYALYKLAIFYDKDDELSKNEIDFLEKKYKRVKWPTSTKKIIKIITKEDINIGIKEENRRFLYELSLIKEIRENKELFNYLKKIKKGIDKVPKERWRCITKIALLLIK